MSDLILDSLEIENFKAFKRLTIDRLGRVNLIVGKNNVGKTCLLEALWLYASRGNPRAIEEMVALRDETIHNTDILTSVKYLIYNRGHTKFEIKIGSAKKNLNVLVLTQDYIVTKERSKGGTYEEKRTSGLKIHFKTSSPFLFNKILNSDLSRLPSQIPYLFVSTQGITSQLTEQLWNKVELTPSEDVIIQALQIIEPKLLGVRLRSQNGKLLPMVRLADLSESVLLRSLGEGMRHIFNFALALVNVKDGFLLIDEIENGLHYSIQSQVWRFIFEMAQRLNVQVFATTHSWDCIEAFKEVTQEFPETEGLLISLWDVKDKPGEVVGVVADKEALNVITQSHIEVR